MAVRDVKPNEDAESERRGEMLTRGLVNRVIHWIDPNNTILI